MNPDRFDAWTEARLAALRGVAEAAGTAILGVYARLVAAAEGGEPGAVDVRRKADRSPVTEADLLADRLIRERLRLLFNGTAVISEESESTADPAEGADAARGYFLVDPLDGTKEFLARNGEFTVNIAWVQGGRVLAGVVHAPALGETFWGAAGAGAWKSVMGGAPGVVQPIHVAAAPRAGAPLRVLASRSHGGAAQRAYLARLQRLVQGDTAADVARGSQPLACIEAGSSLKFCRLAEGAADLYPRLSATMPWDTAAGQAVLEAAGGVVLGTEGAPLRVPGRPREAPNPPFFAASSAELAQRAVAAL